MYFQGNKTFLKWQHYITFAKLQIRLPFKLEQNVVLKFLKCHTF